jgi:lantibiotic modifying enzyme
MDGLMTEQELRTLAARASTLRERLAGGYVAVGFDDRAVRDAAQARLVTWRQTAAAGKLDLFANHLTREGFNEAAVLPWLGTVRLAEDEKVPQWTAEFAWIAAALAATPPPSGSPPEETGPVPFAELLWPAVLAADERLDERSGSALLAFAPAARAALRQLLLRRLSGFCARAVFWEFSTFRDYAVNHSAAATPAGREPSRTIYDAFVADWRVHSRDFFAARPVLARMIATIVVNWLAATVELANRLACDRPVLGGAFADGRDLGLVTSLETGLSDAHRSGRVVAVLGFGDGLKIVYKPKDLRIDIAWGALLRWLDDNGAPVPLMKAPMVVAREGYGWAEFVPADDRQATRPDAVYHRRAGGLLALFHLLQSADFHHENVIASGGCPIPVAPPRRPTAWLGW